MYLKNLLIAIDQLGNTLAGGNPDNTISARVGHFAQHSDGSQGKFWRGMERVIDWAFHPLDGPGHCRQSAARSTDEVRRPGNDGTRAILAVLAVPVCAVVGVLFRLPGLKLRRSSSA